MTDREVMKMALDALENPHSGWIQREKNAREALRKELAKPEQTIVPFPSFMRRRIEEAIDLAINPKGMSVHDGKATVYASDLQRMIAVIDLAPPRKPWVGLTDEDIKGILDCDRGWMVDIKKAEQILKDKNT